jgi:hypothetical protein
METSTVFAPVVLPARSARRARHLAELEEERTVSRLFREACSLVGFTTADRMFSDARLMTDETWTGKDAIALAILDDLYDRTMRERGGRP